MKVLKTFMIPGFPSSASMNLIFVEFNLYAYIGWIARDPIFPPASAALYV